MAGIAFAGTAAHNASAATSPVANRFLAVARSRPQQRCRCGGRPITGLSGPRARVFSSVVLPTHRPYTTPFTCTRSFTTVAEVKQLQEKVASLVADKNWDDALLAATECREAVDDLTGQTHPAYGSALNNLALVYKSIGDLEPAAALYEDALSVYRRVYGDVHPSPAMAMHNMATLYLRQGNTEKATRMCRGALEIRRKIYGPSHKDVAISMYTLGAILTADQQLTSAEQILREAVAVLLDGMGCTFIDVYFQ